MLRTAAVALLLAFTVQGQTPTTAPKVSYPADQQEVMDRLDQIQNLQRAVAREFGLRRTEGLERIRDEIKALQAALHKRLSGTGLKDWVGTVKVLEADKTTFEVAPGLNIRTAVPGMDGLTRGAVKSLQQGETVTLSIAPVLLADVVLEGQTLVVVVGGRHLSLQKGRPM